MTGESTPAVLSPATLVDLVTPSVGEVSGADGTLACRAWRVWRGSCGVSYDGNHSTKAVNRGLQQDPLGLAALALVLAAEREQA